MEVIVAILKVFSGLCLLVFLPVPTLIGAALVFGIKWAAKEFAKAQKTMP